MRYAMSTNSIGFQYLTSIVPSYAPQNAILVEIDHCNYQWIGFTSIHLYNIDKLIFFFLYEHLKVTDSDGYGHVPRGSEGNEADSREDRDSEAIADNATLPSRSIARHVLQWSSNWPVRSTMWSGSPPTSFPSLDSFFNPLAPPS